MHGMRQLYFLISKNNLRKKLTKQLLDALLNEREKANDQDALSYTLIGL